MTTLIIVALAVATYLLAIQVMSEKHNNKRLSLTAERRMNLFEKLMSHINDNGGFHDSCGNWKSEVEQSNPEIVKHYDTMYQIEREYYFGNRDKKII
jgi:hypothetical protein